MVSEQLVREALKEVYDPELQYNIVDLGLVYDVAVIDGKVHVLMTLTSPGCFAAQIIPGEVKHKVKGVEGVQSAKVDIVWDPPWTPALMSDAAKLQLNMFW